MRIDALSWLSRLLAAILLGEKEPQADLRAFVFWQVDRVLRRTRLQLIRGLERSGRPH
jgi:hypothetical protein